VNGRKTNLVPALVVGGLFCLATGLVAPRLQGQTVKYPAQLRVRLDWECKPKEERRLRAEALLGALAKAVHNASGQRWCIESFVVDDGYTPFNLADQGVIYFHEKHEGPATEDLTPDAKKVLKRWPHCGDLSLPGYVDLGLDQFKDAETSRRAYAEKAAKAVLLAWTGKESQPEARTPAPFSPPRFHRRSGLKVVVRTGDDQEAGTDDAVSLDLGLGAWRLDNEDHNDFLPGAEDTFLLSPGYKFRAGKLIRVRLTKVEDQHRGQWLLQAVELWYRGECLFRSPCLFRWLELDKRTWQAPFKTGVADEPLKESDQVKSLVLAIGTGMDPLAGTADPVQVHLGKATFAAKPTRTEWMEPNTLTVIRPAVANLRTLSDLTDIRITKSPGKPETAWQLKRLAVYVNQQLLYEKKDANTWLPAKAEEEGDAQSKQARNKAMVSMPLEWKAEDYQPPAAKPGPSK